MEAGLAQISSRELTGWRAWERQHGPIGPERDDLHAAMICWTLACIHAGKGQRPKLEDFMPRFSAARTEADPDRLLARARAITAQLSAGLDSPTHAPGRQG